MKVETFTGAILSKKPGMGKVQTKFFIRICKLYLTVRGRYNFLNFARYGVIKDGKVQKAFIYFSTDCEMTGEQLITHYDIRFQIEFLYRDAKQFLGLNQSQSRQKEAIDFHINMALTVLNIAKSIHWLPIPKAERPAFSMADIKTQYVNELILDRIISLYGKDPIIEKNNHEIRKLYDLGRIAA